MNISGMISAYEAYTSFSSPVYGVVKVNSKQKTSDEVSSTNTSSNDDINDEAIISDEAKALLAMDEAYSKDKTFDENKSQNQNNTSPDSQNTSKVTEELTPAQKQEVAELKARDVEVKAHEQAHLSAAAGLGASAPHYDYQMGPDGKKYAIGGEVNINFTESQDPSENLAKAEAMRAAALAPAQPSGQDRSVAAQADRMIVEAEEELKTQNSDEETQSSDKTGETSSKEDSVMNDNIEITKKTDSTSDDSKG